MRATRSESNQRARYYDARLGRFTGEDPSGFAAGDANLNRLVGNHPTMATDPSGREEDLTAVAQSMLDELCRTRKPSPGNYNCVTPPIERTFKSTPFWTAVADHLEGISQDMPTRGIAEWAADRAAESERMISEDASLNQRGYVLSSAWGIRIGLVKLGTGAIGFVADPAAAFGSIARDREQSFAYAEEVVPESLTESSWLVRWYIAEAEFLGVNGLHDVGEGRGIPGNALSQRESDRRLDESLGHLSSGMMLAGPLAGPLRALTRPKGAGIRTAEPLLRPAATEAPVVSGGNHGTLGSWMLEKSRAFEVERSIPKSMENTPRNGTLDILETRKWYRAQEAKILDEIDSNLPLRERAIQAFNKRNELRTKARDLMSDRAEAARLMREEPNMTLQEIVRHKYKNKGLVGDALWQDIIDTAPMSRTSINKKLGLE